MEKRQLKHKLAALLTALAILLSIFVGCQDNWDGMDRSGWDWSGNAARVEEMRR